MLARFANTATRYGGVSKLLHWTVFLLFLNQFAVAIAMLNTGRGETTAGFTQGALYNWHKSIGLVLFGIVLVRLAWRKFTPLPDWAPNLSGGERRWMPRIEATLYAGMFLMPVSGLLFVMAGGYGVNFFSAWPLPEFVAKSERVAAIAGWTHRITAWLVVITLLAHWGLGIRHHRRHRDRYLHRMLPFTRQR